ncbi:MAG TPA: hypothetical protein VNO33_18285 [Kofleriaceae bacterium]|nr:hypothetical protein [Kofleriaceae bacterium]
MLRSPVSFLLVLVGFLATPALTACSRTAEPAQPQAPATGPEKPAAPASATGGIGAPKIPWARKTRSQRQDYMGIYVLPRMEKLFAEWRPDEYGKFRCQHCHGESFDKPPVDFAMPRVSFPLAADDPIGAAMKYDAEATRFMVEKVMPAMAELLGEKPHDPSTGQGFSCFRCHPKAGAVGAKP